MQLFKKNAFRKGTDKIRRRTFIGILTIILGCAAIYFWVNFAERELTYDTVLVLNKPLSVNEIVTGDMLSELKVPKENVVKGSLKTSSGIVGKEAKIEIPAGMQLTNAFFTDSKTTLDKNQSVLYVPESWIFSCPQTIRRGDKVCFYSIPNEEIREESGNGATLVLEDTEKVLEATVLYVKDTANREVTDVEKNQPRFSGSSVVSQIEIAVTEAQYKTLYNSFATGHQFIIMYP